MSYSARLVSSFGAGVIKAVTSLFNDTLEFFDLARLNWAKTYEITVQIMMRVIKI